MAYFQRRTLSFQGMYLTIEISKPQKNELNVISPQVEIAGCFFSIHETLMDQVLENMTDIKPWLKTILSNVQNRKYDTSPDWLFNTDPYNNSVKKKNTIYTVSKIVWDLLCWDNHTYVGCCEAPRVNWSVLSAPNQRPGCSCHDLRW